MIKRLILSVVLILSTVVVFGQEITTKPLRIFDYSRTPREYEIGGVTVSGAKYLTHNVLLQFSGLDVGKRLRFRVRPFQQPSRNCGINNSFQM